MATAFSVNCFDGKLDKTNVGEILRALHVEKETGLLSFKNEGVAKSLFLRNGEIIYTLSTLANENLPAHLVKARVIDEDQHFSLLKLIAQGYTAEQVIITKKILDVKGLLPYIRETMYEIASSLFQWHIGEFRWVYGVHPKLGTISTPLPLASVILGGLEAYKDAEILQRWLGALTAVPKPTLSMETLGKLKISPLHGFLLSRIDGASTFRQLIAISGMSRAGALAFLYSAFLSGLIQLDEDSLIQRDYTFDIELEKEATYRRVSAAQLGKDGFGISAEDVTMDDEVTVIIDGEEMKMSELFNEKLTIKDIEDAEANADGRPAYIPLNANGLEIKYRLWRKDQDRKEQRQKEADLRAKGPRAYNASDGQSLSAEAVQLQVLKGEIRKLVQHLHNLNHYEVLGLSPDSTMRDIYKAYQELSAKYNPEGHSAKDLGNLFSPLTDIHQRIEQAWAVLSDPAQKDAYDASMADQIRKQQLAVQRKREMAERNFEQGNQEFAKKDVMRALDFYRAAISLDAENARYYERLSIALATNKKWLKDSMRILRSAIKIEPENAQYHVVMGQICKMAGARNAAVRAFRKALKIMPGNERLAKEIQSLFETPQGAA